MGETAIFGSADPFGGAFDTALDEVDALVAIFGDQIDVCHPAATSSDPSVGLSITMERAILRLELPRGYPEAKQLSATVVGSEGLPQSVLDKAVSSLPLGSCAVYELYQVVDDLLKAQRCPAPPRGASPAPGSPGTVAAQTARIDRQWISFIGFYTKAIIKDFCREARDVVSARRLGNTPRLLRCTNGGSRPRIAGIDRIPYARETRGCRSRRRARKDCGLYSYHQNGTFCERLGSSMCFAPAFTTFPARLPPPPPPLSTPLTLLPTSSPLFRPPLYVLQVPPASRKMTLSLRDDAIPERAFHDFCEVVTPTALGRCCAPILLLDLGRQAYTPSLSVKHWNPGYSCCRKNLHLAILDLSAAGHSAHGDIGKHQHASRTQAPRHR